MPNADYPYWRLSAFYAWYFALLGGLVPYWGLYLKSLNFNAEQIGLLMSTFMGTKIIAPNVWGYLADKGLPRLRIVQLGAILTVISFVGIFWATSFFALMGVMIAFSFFWNAILPQYEVITFRKLADNIYFYGRVRLWGSVGFIATVIGLGLILDFLPISFLPWILFGIILGIWVSSLTIQYTEFSSSSKGNAASFWSILKQPDILGFFFICFLMQVSHGPYYTFFSIYLEALNYTKTEIGLFWALGVFIEVAIFWSMHLLLRYFSLQQILIVSLGFAVIRWILIGEYAESLIAIIIAQSLHAATFGSFHAAAIHFVQKTFHQHHEGKGQALYSSTSFGAGGAIGALYSGFAWDALGPTWSFFSAAMIGLLAMVLAMAVFKKTKNQNP